jgi:hypothetical protein
VIKIIAITYKREAIMGKLKRNCRILLRKTVKKKKNLVTKFPKISLKFKKLT